MGPRGQGWQGREAGREGTSLAAERLGCELGCDRRVLGHRGRWYSQPSETPVSSRCLGRVLMRCAGSLDSRRRKLKTWGDLNGHGCGLWKQKTLSGPQTTGVGEVEFSLLRRPLHLITGVASTCSQEKPGSTEDKKKQTSASVPSLHSSFPTISPCLHHVGLTFHQRAPFLQETPTEV